MKKTNVTAERGIDQYRRIAGDRVIDEIHHYADRLQGEHIVMINSTPAGGGVAEILNNLVLLINELGVELGWRILKGSDTFFQITKEFHNAFQGADITLTKQKKEIYEQVNRNNAMMTHLDGHDMVIVHDPQPLPLISYYKKRIPWVWRFHPDMTHPNPKLLEYLKPYIELYDAMIISSKKYHQASLDIPQIEFAPSIDPLSAKNVPMTKTEAHRLLRRQGLRLNKPIIAQVSRFDTWKDPVGVIKAFLTVREQYNCQLVLMGNLASDDPEGPIIYQQVLKAARNNKDIHILLNSPDNDRTVNALQRSAAVILQKSLREGFALTVSEALWKETPVIGTRAGGIPLQVIDGKTGLLVRGIPQTAEACLKLLTNRTRARRLGRQGKEHVRKHFLITRHVLDYLKLFDYYLNARHTFHAHQRYPHS